MKKETGILCHISSLPGPFGIGCLGKEAYAFARRLSRSGVTLWQTLPLVQTGFGDSPYQSVACGSLNPYFIDLRALRKQKLLTKEELSSAKKKGGSVDYGALASERIALLRTAFSRFHFDSEPFSDFIKTGSAEDYALYMTAKTVYGETSAWEGSLRRHDPAAVEKLRTDHHEEYLFWQFLQYEFTLQWTALKQDCNRRGISLIGDLPLYVAYDSADVWAHPGLFKLDGDLRPVKVAGVPPDYFSEDGQLWGNPVYDWAAHEKENFAWWTNRLKSALRLFDYVRIDHFRGIDRYYEIDAAAETARVGEWQDGPKEKLFAALKGERKKIIAEDLGLIDDGVRALLQKTGFPGMKVLLFAFDGDPSNPFLPRNTGENCVMYTGTHDNDTVAGYVKSLSVENFILFRSRVAQALADSGLNIPLSENPKSFALAFEGLALRSDARFAVIPIQDVLALDNSARMNTPGTKEGNWRFRLTRIPSAHSMHRLKKMIKIYRR